MHTIASAEYFSQNLQLTFVILELEQKYLIQNLVVFLSFHTLYLTLQKLARYWSML